MSPKTDFAAVGLMGRQTYVEVLGFGVLALANQKTSGGILPAVWLVRC